MSVIHFIQIEIKTKVVYKLVFTFLIILKYLYDFEIPVDSMECI